VDAISGAAKIVLRGIGGASPQKWRRHHRPPPTTEQQTRHGAQGTPNGVWGRAPSGGLGAGPHPPRVPFGHPRRDFVNARARDVADYIPLRTSHESRAPRPLPQPQPEPDPITRMFQRGTAGSPKHDPSTANYLPKARREGFWLRGFQGALFQVAPKF
jgi:hypothetical protein